MDMVGLGATLNHSNQMAVGSKGSFAGWLQRVRKTGEHSDVIVKVQGEEFKLHMLPLVNESAYFRSISEKSRKNASSSRLVSSSSGSNSSSGSSGSSSSQDQVQEQKDECSTSRKSRSRNCRVIEINELPGGSDAFSMAADFCYIIRPNYTFKNVASVRAAAEFLGMNDLVESTKKYLYANVFSSWRNCVAFLTAYHRVYQPTDKYIESRALKVVAAACTKAFLETKHVSVPISFAATSAAVASSSSISSHWSSSSPSHNLRDLLVSVSGLPRPYGHMLMQLLVEGDANLNIKCRQSRSVRDWIDYVVRRECRRVEQKAWVVLCLSKLLLKNAPTEQRPWLELSSQYWCSLLEHSGILVREHLDAETLEALRLVKAELEYRIGSSLHELDDYIQAYSFEPDTLLSLVRHFLPAAAAEIDGDAEVEAVASEVDGSLWGYAERGLISVDTFVALAEAFPGETRSCHDMLFSAVERFLEKRKQGIDAEGIERVWRSIDCSKLSTPVYERAMNNASYVCQPHVLECVLRKHSQELEANEFSEGQQQQLRAILHKVIQASLKLLEENSKRSQEITELQKQLSTLLNSGLKVFPSQDSCDNSPTMFHGLDNAGLGLDNDANNKNAEIKTGNDEIEEEELI